MKCTQTVNWRILTHDFQRKYRDWFLGACVYIFIKQWLHYHLQASSYFNSCPNRLHLFSLTFSKENGHIHPYRRKLVKKKWSKEKKAAPGAPEPLELTPSMPTVRPQLLRGRDLSGPPPSPPVSPTAGLLEPGLWGSLCPQSQVSPSWEGGPFITSSVFLRSGHSRHWRRKVFS